MDETLVMSFVCLEFSCRLPTSIERKGGVDNGKSDLKSGNGAEENVQGVVGNNEMCKVHAT